MAEDITDPGGDARYGAFGMAAREAGATRLYPGAFGRRPDIGGAPLLSRGIRGPIAAPPANEPAVSPTAGAERPDSAIDAGIASAPAKAAGTDAAIATVPEPDEPDDPAEAGGLDDAAVDDGPSQSGEAPGAGAVAASLLSVTLRNGAPPASPDPGAEPSAQAGPDVSPPEPPGEAELARKLGISFRDGGPGAGAAELGPTGKDAEIARQLGIRFRDDDIAPAAALDGMSEEARRLGISFRDADESMPKLRKASLTLRLLVLMLLFGALAGLVLFVINGESLLGSVLG